MYKSAKQASLTSWVKKSDVKMKDESSKSNGDSNSKDRVSVNLHPAVRKSRVLPNTVISSKNFLNTFSSTSIISKRKAEELGFNQYTNPQQSKNPKLDESDSESELPDISYSLSQSQFRALRAIMKKKSVFFTGAAGIYIFQKKKT
jgi:hypothetical protein